MHDSDKVMFRTDVFDYISSTDQCINRSHGWQRARRNLILSAITFCMKLLDFHTKILEFSYALLRIAKVGYLAASDGISACIDMTWLDFFFAITTREDKLHLN